MVFLAQAPPLNRPPGGGEGCHPAAPLAAQRWPRGVSKGYEQVRSFSCWSRKVCCT